jgi:hypothetical protein
MIAVGKITFVHECHEKKIKSFLHLRLIKADAAQYCTVGVLSSGTAIRKEKSRCLQAERQHMIQKIFRAACSRMRYLFPKKIYQKHKNTSHPPLFPRLAPEEEYRASVRMQSIG